jgi:NAD(P)-dependent dehydrogenase (short-subunit alcohol dehydrogenase family)
MSRPFAIVTGASSGIGFALAHELAQRGYDVAICSSGDRLSTAAADLRSTGALVFEFRAQSPASSSEATANTRNSMMPFPD